MPSPIQPIKFRNERRQINGRKPLLKVGLGCSLFISLLLAGLCLAGFWSYANLTRQLPSVDTLAALLEPPAGTLLEPTRLFDRTHQHILLTLENPLASRKQYLQVLDDGHTAQGEFSKYLIDATITEFEPGFWESPGYSLEGLVEGTHPTIAQQLVSELVMNGEAPSLGRSIRERLLAAQVTAKYGREKVLEWYLNSLSYGELIYGADAAARVYFGKSASNITLAEAAMLTAIAGKPEINPRSGSKLLEEKQHAILSAMLADGSIGAVEAKKALAEKISFQDQPALDLLAPDYTALVLEQVSTIMPLKQVMRGGFDITTSLDYDLQSQAQCASEIQLGRAEGRSTINSQPTDNTCEAARLLPTISTGKSTQAGDLAAEVIILDPHSGQVLAMVGSSNTGMEPAEPVTHPAGTILSPLLYLTAFARGMSPATLLWDIPGAGESLNLPPASPEQNQTTIVTYHGPVRARMALINDYQAANQEVLQHVGAENVWLTERRFGIAAAQENNIVATTLESFVSQPASLLEATQAYAVLANQGLLTGYTAGINNKNITERLSPITVLRIVSANGKVWLDEPASKSVAVVNQQLAYLLTNVLSDEAARIPSLGRTNALEIGRPASAKFSLAEPQTETWTVGYIPQMAVGVWVGYLQNADAKGINDITAGLWHAIIQYASNPLPVEDFAMPSGISKIQVCDPSGMLVSDLCPSIVQEVFLQGEEPTQVDNLYQKITIDRETGLLATVFTPPVLQVEKVFLIMPPQALKWATQAGIAIPPDRYDSINTTQQGSSDVQFTQPEMFEQVRGRIELIGNATGKDFSYYSLQVGKGLYPKEWLQISQNIDQPVNNGPLGSWDTTGLEGLYMVQLQVVRKDTRIERAYLQVTVDNSAPDVQILSPTGDDQITYQTGQSVLLRVNASDNLVLERVEFYVDDGLSSTLHQPPYVSVWTERLGKHVLMVKAYDLAGNLTSATISFSVVK